MSELSKELNETIRLLEKGKIPAAPVDHESLEKRLARDMQDYFRVLSDALPWNDLEALYYKLVQKEQ